MTFKSDWLYTDVVKRHFMKPQNILMDENDFDFNGKGTTGNIKCGDEMTVFIKVDDKKGTITDCKWQTFGCASAIASTSMLSEMVKGMALEKAYKLSPKDIAKELGGLPDNKVHCSVLGDKALRLAIDDYYQKNGMEDKVVKDEATVVCNCMNVTDHDIEEAVLEGARTYLELQEHTKIGTGCGGCKSEAIVIMEQYVEQHFGD